MVGSNEEPGIVPRMCGALFDRVALENQTTATDESGPTFKVEVSMLEIYNERIRDLLVPPRRQQSGGLKVRDAPKTGACVRPRGARRCSFLRPPPSHAYPRTTATSKGSRRCPCRRPSSSPTSWRTVRARALLRQRT